MFANEYIALIAGLREYSLESDVKGLDLGAILSEVFDELTASDALLVYQLYGLYDCENIVSTFNKSSRRNPLALMSEEQIEALLRGEEMDGCWLSEGMLAVIERYTSSGNDVAISTEESFSSALYAAYYATVESSKNKMLKEWSRSERSLRNITAALGARATDRAVESVLVGSGDIVDQIKRSSAADFALRGELTYIDSLMAAVGDSTNIIDQEHKIDQIRWEIVDELSQMEYFTMDALLAYLVRVNMVVRWQKLNPEYGREVFERLITSLKAQ